MSTRNRVLSSVLLVTSVVVGSLSPAIALQAAPLVVNSERDAPDLRPGDGVCEIELGRRECTLRAAIRKPMLQELTASWCQKVPTHCRSSAAMRMPQQRVISISLTP